MNRNRPLKPQQTLTYVISIFAYAYVFRCVGECVWHVAPKHTHHVRPSEGHAIPICYTCVCVCTAHWQVKPVGCGLTASLHASTTVTAAISPRAADACPSRSARCWACGWMGVSIFIRNRHPFKAWGLRKRMSYTRTNAAYPS